jgi:hypothetical protein
VIQGERARRFLSADEIRLPVSGASFANSRLAHSGQNGKISPHASLQ